MKIIVIIFSCILAVLTCCCCLPSCRQAMQDGPAHLVLLHTNDTHAHLSYIANRYTLNSRLEKEAAEADILLLDAGDVFAGTPYFSLYKGQADLWFMNYMKYDAMCLGNHEFDKGPDVLEKFVQGALFPVLCANFDLSNAGALSAQIKPWIIIERGHNRYGILGITTEETAEISDPGPLVVVNDHVAFAAKAVQYLRSRGVNKIIALTHIGWDNDMALAEQVEGIDIIVGGHSHTVPQQYPTVVNKFSAPTLIVQAGCYGQYLGRLEADFNSQGVLSADSKGQLFTVDDKITADKVCSEKLQEYAAPIEKLMQKPVGSTKVELDGERGHVRTMETNLGNLIADAMLDKAKQASAELALVQGGGIRTSLAQGDISLGQIYDVLPFDNYLVCADITGIQLLEALENGVSQVEAEAGRFLQVSGLRYSWDTASAPGTRITSAEIKTEHGFMPVEKDKTYCIVTNDYIAGGGDGYDCIKATNRQINLGFAVTDTVAEYIGRFSPVNPRVEGRILRSGK